MGADTVIYGHSRGYRFLALISVLAFLISLTLTVNRPGINWVAAAGVLGFAVLTTYSLHRSVRRIEVMRITEDGFSITDPAQAFGNISYDGIGEIRIFALQAKPRVGFCLIDPDRIRRQGPAITRVVVIPLWKLRQYQIVVELDELNDQIGAIKSVAVRTGIPVRSELL